MLNLFIPFLLFCSFAVYAQPADSVYYLKFYSSETQEEISFASLIATENGIRTGEWTSNVDGIFKLTRISANTKFKAGAAGFNDLSFDANSLKASDTAEFKLMAGYQSIEMIEIIRYRVPVIDPDKLSRREKKRLSKLPLPDSSNIYKPEVRARYDSIVNGTWFKENKKGARLNREIFYAYFSRMFNYPEHAFKYDIEETVYFNLTIAKDGSLKQISLAKGNCPVLVIEVARVLQTISQIMFIDSYYWTDSHIFAFPVKFRLR